MTQETVTLKDATKVLNKAVSHVSDIFNEINLSDLPTLLKYYRALYEQLDELDKIVKIATALKQELSHDIIPKQMEMQRFDSIKTAGRTFLISGRMSASVQDKLKARAWLEANGYVWEEIATINSQTLSSLCRAALEEKGIEPNEAEDGIKISKLRYVQMRK